MHTIRGENIDGSSDRRGNRRNEDCEATVLMFFDDECGDESLLNLSQRRLPCLILRLASQLLRKASNQFVARDSLEQRGLRSLPGRSPRWSANNNPNEEA